MDSSTENLIVSGARRSSGAERLIVVQSDDAKDGGSSTAGRSVKETCFRFVKFCFSTGGLVLLVIIYVTGGAFAFQYLELENEKADCNNQLGDYTTAETASVGLLMNVIYDAIESPINASHGRAESEDSVKSVLRAFSNSVIETKYSYGKNCSLMGLEGGPQHQWTIGAAFFFSMTVVTTIGYGNIAPKTIWGRLVCVFYAMLGIPITLLCLAHVGLLMANVIRFLYSTVCCCSCCRHRKPLDAAPRGAIAPNGGLGRHPSAPRGVADAKPRWVTDATGKPLQGPPATLPEPPTSGYNADLTEEDEYDDEDDEEQRLVPFVVPLLAIMFTVVAGAGAFTAWEDWSLLDGSYFCFITMATIGFGDLVPRFASLPAGEAEAEIAASVLYMIMGVSTLAMCLQLVQDDVIARLKQAAAKIGMRKNRASIRGGEESDA